MFILKTSSSENAINKREKKNFMVPTISVQILTFLW